MKRVALAALIAFEAFAWQPIFEEYKTVQIGSTDFKDLPIYLYSDSKFRGYPAVNWMDYNEDGLNDMVIGLFDRGAIMVSENSGTANAPKFEEYKFLTTAGDNSFAQPI